MKHAELVAVASRWLNGQGCGVIITEMTSAAHEQPDAIGWKGRDSWLIECKASRADFLADAKKHFRRFADQAMGTHRYYLAPAGLLRPDEIPAPWGLLAASGRGVSVAKSCTRNATGTRAYEVELLTSALRRLLVQPAVSAVRCKTYVIDGKGEPRATLAAVADPASRDMEVTDEMVMRALDTYQQMPNADAGSSMRLVLQRAKKEWGGG